MVNETRYSNSTPIAPPLLAAAVQTAGENPNLHITEPSEPSAPAISNNLSRGFSYGKIAVISLLIFISGVFLARNVILGTPVDAYAASRGDLRQSVVASGRVIWPQRISVASEVIGRVTKIPVLEGQQVSRDQLLIQLENNDELANITALEAAANLAQAKLRQQREITLPAAEENLKQARINAAQTHKQHTRMQQLIGQEFVSAEELETAANSLNLARSRLEQSNKR
jgi:HlyD family secretion protein